LQHRSDPLPLKTAHLDSSLNGLRQADVIPLM
jgi:hypothetical protein